MDAYSTLRNGLIGAWCPSLGAGGSVIRDFSAVRGDAAVTAGSYSAIQGGVALSFNGTTSVASSSRPQSFLNGSAVASQSMWMYRATASVSVASGFSSTNTGANGSRFSAIWFTDGNVYISVENASGTYGVFPLSGAGIRHVAFVFDGTQSTNAAKLVMFANGSQVTASSFVGTLPSTLSSTLGNYDIGKDASNRFGAGSLDDVRVYNRTLTLAEIKLLASQRGIGLVPTGRTVTKFPTTLYQNVGGVWKPTQAQVNVGGTWKTASPATNVGGVWK